MLPKKITVIEWLEPEDRVWVLESCSYKSPKKAMAEFRKNVEPEFYKDFQAYEIQISE